MANENETVEQVCEEMRSFGNVPPPMFAWRDLAERGLAAHEREIEIASKYSAEHEARIFDALRKRDALIKELADALWDENGYSYSKLIAKAREVSNG